jgi:hypothetical protein
LKELEQIENTNESTKDDSMLQVDNLSADSRLMKQASNEVVSSLSDQISLVAVTANEEEMSEKGTNPILNYPNFISPASDMNVTLTS